jgi:hypothetical protein
VVKLDTSNRVVLVYTVSNHFVCRVYQTILRLCGEGKRQRRDRHHILVMNHEYFSNEVPYDNKLLVIVRMYQAKSNRSPKALGNLAIRLENKRHRRMSSSTPHASPDLLSIRFRNHVESLRTQLNLLPSPPRLLMPDSTGVLGGEEESSQQSSKQQRQRGDRVIVRLFG